MRQRKSVLRITATPNINLLHFQNPKDWWLIRVLLCVCAIQRALGTLYTHNVRSFIRENWWKLRAESRALCLERSLFPGWQLVELKPKLNASGCGSLFDSHAESGTHCLVRNDAMGEGFTRACEVVFIQVVLCFHTFKSSYTEASVRSFIQVRLVWSDCESSDLVSIATVQRFPLRTVSVFLHKKIWKALIYHKHFYAFSWQLCEWRHITVWSARDPTIKIHCKHAKFV